MIREIHFVLLVTAILILPSRLAVSAEGQPTAASFEKDIRPIFEQNCFPCHTKSQHTSGLVLETLEGALQGGALNGPALKAGDSATSPLILYLRGEKKPAMPMGRRPLTDEQIASIATWIDEVKMPAQAVQKSAPGRSSRWPFTRLTLPEIPPLKRPEWVKNPVDAFLLARLEEKGMEPAPPVSKRVLLRRLYSDLIGLPPTPEEMDRFLNDPSPVAYDREIDRLLADPRYGERWGRHWLDLVRYADSAGNAAPVSMMQMPHMWRYRDYVIRAFNQDRPYNRFVRQQLAGDAFSYSYGAEGKIGLGFLTLGVQSDGGDDEVRRTMLIDMVDTTGSVFLGLTVGCARCHNHKYDPIPIKDYYRLEAFFAPVTVSVVPLPFSQYENPDELVRKGKEWEQVLSKRKESQAETLSQFKKRVEPLRLWCRGATSWQ